MDQLKNFADDRLVVGCIYCGGVEETREHVPSKVFLDAPLPDNLPIVPACRACNNGFSLDEEYLACLIESVIAGSTDPSKIRRPSIANILNRTSLLRTKLESAKSVDNGKFKFSVERSRVENVIIKLARGHAVYELNQPCRDAPASVWWMPLILIDEESRQDFESVHIVDGYPEVGSRNMQRMLIANFTLQDHMGSVVNQAIVINDWIEVQDGRYRYHAIDYGDAIVIKFVIGDYLACEVMWDRS